MQTKLYSDFAELYHLVYPSFIDYEEQYRFYSGLLEKYRVRSLLEIGCGSGYLAQKMLSNGWDYTGMDLSHEMLGLARATCPGGRFFQGDMRYFALDSPVEALIIPARSVSYLLENKDIEAAFGAMRKALCPDGLLIFDYIDAAHHFLHMEPGKEILHQAQNGSRSWERKSIYFKNLDTGWTWDWHSEYYEMGKDGNKTLVASDQATLRAFIPEEIALFLQLSGFEVTEQIETGSYAFKNHCVVARNTAFE